MSDDLWQKWKRGARVDDLAREVGCTRERMLHRLKKLEEGHLQADTVDELARLRADVESLTASLAAEVEESERLRAALVDERRHANVLAEALERRDSGAHERTCCCNYSDPSGCDCGHVEAEAALAQHRTRRQEGKSDE